MSTLLAKVNFRPLTLQTTSPNSQQEENILPVTPNQLTKEPLVKEFSIAAQIWKLSSCNLWELARNFGTNNRYWQGMKSGFTRESRSNISDSVARFRQGTGASPQTA